ncbi:MAG: ABC transporter permease [Crocinitomicaceae bacterium]|jgi:lipopolysaccharide transport system permease protein|nr:ABC transporter permease [Crocinitomicaceae bacterium]
MINKEAGWTEIISPVNSYWNMKLGELFRYRDLIFLFVKRDFSAVYKQTILGPLWLFIQPIFTTLIFFFVFTKIAKIPTGGIDPILFYLAGITLWNYFSDCFVKTSNTFVANAGIYGKVYFPRLVIPISIVISNLIKLGVQLIVFAVVFIYKINFEGLSFSFHSTLFFLPVLILIMAILGLGLGIVFSALTTKYRDFSFLLAFGIQLLMYATPIIYPLSYTSGQLNKWISLNPLTPLIENFKFALFGIGHFDYVGLLYAACISVIILFVGIIFFNRVEKNFMDTV